MTFGTTYRELLSNMVWIDCIVVIVTMAANARIGWISIVTLMAIIAFQTGVVPFYWIKIMVESRRCPGSLCMATCTICRELLSCVVRIGGGIEVIGMTTGTCIGRIGVIPLMTIIA